MRVVYAYRSFPDRCDLISNPWETFLFKASLLSWIKYCPRAERVLYCDSTVRVFLETKAEDIVHFLDRIIEVNFEEELDKRYPRNHHFFAYPKMYAMCQQTEPFFICDTDGILRSNVSEWFDETKYYAVYYNSDWTNRTPDYSPKEALRKISYSCTGRPALRSFCDYTNTINAGLLYFADPRVAQLVGHLILTLGTDIQDSFEEIYKKVPSPLGNDFIWTLYEESLLGNLIKYITKQPIEVVREGQFEECSGCDGSEEWMFGCVERAVTNLDFNFLTTEYEKLQNKGSLC